MGLADAQEMGNKYVINCFCFDSANVMEETEKVDQEGAIPDKSITQPFAEGNIELSGDNCDVTGEVNMTGDTNEMEELPEETKGTGIQVFREMLSEKVHATILKGIVGGFEFTVLQRNLK